MYNNLWKIKIPLNINNQFKEFDILIHNKIIIMKKDNNLQILNVLALKKIKIVMLF